MRHFWFSIKLASQIAIDNVLENLPSNAVREVHFILFTQSDYLVNQEYLSNVNFD